MSCKLSPLVTATLVLSAVGAITAFALVPGCGDATTLMPPKSLPVVAPRPPSGIVEEVNAELRAAWQSAGLSPASEADDSTFLRRVTLDLTGVVPTATETKAFQSSVHADKRQRLVRRLLSSARYVQHWTNYWDELLMGPPTQRGLGKRVDRMAFRRWLYAQLAADRPYDAWVRELLTASGQNSSGGRPDLSQWDLDNAQAIARSEGVNGAVNFLIRHGQKPQNLAGQVASRFLGVQIQCAECHDHPSEKWTQRQFQQFTASFMHSGVRGIDRGRVEGLRRMELVDFDVSDARERRQVARRVKRSGYSDEQPITLDGAPLADDVSRRAALARWMTERQNPWFAQALVNRIWATLLGRGFVHPVEAFGQSSESTKIASPEILRLLTNDFVDKKMSLRELLKTICLSDAYGRSAHGGDGSENSYALWHRFRPRAMNASQLLDSLVEVGQIRPLMEDLVGDRYARIKFNLRQRFTFTFSGEDDDVVDDTFTGTVPQALMLLNGVVAGGASAALRGSALGAIRNEPGTTQDKVGALYRLALSRLPRADELAFWNRYLGDTAASTAATRQLSRERTGNGRPRGPLGRLYRMRQLKDFSPADEAYEDMLWVLLNSNEFFFIH